MKIVKKPDNRRVESLYWSVNVQAYRTRIPEGVYIVVDYGSDSEPDREVYLESGTYCMAPYKEEYKAASKAVDQYLTAK